MREPSEGVSFIKPDAGKTRAERNNHSRKAPSKRRTDRVTRQRRAPPATGEPSTQQGGVLMDAQLDGTQTSGRKGISYDWQALLVPAEPEFIESLNELIDDEVVAERGN